MMRFFEDVAVGDEFVSHTAYLVTAEEITSYAGKWDPQPYHVDEEQAKRTVVGRLFAPSILTLAISVRLSHESGYCDISSVAGLGIDELRMRKPVLVADALKVKATVVSMRESKSRSGLGVMTTKIEVINQNGEVVLSYLLSGLVNKRPR
jgi:acyl dehydratase